MKPLSRFLLLSLAAAAMTMVSRANRPSSSRLHSEPPKPVEAYRTPWGWGLLALAVLAAGILGGSRYLQSRYESVEIARILTGGDPARAPWLFTRYGCGGCHTIAGVAGADGRVGPPLQELRERVYIAGRIENNAANLIGWIADPTRLSPDTAMPPSGISVTEARDIAAYLYAH